MSTSRRLVLAAGLTGLATRALPQGIAPPRPGAAASGAHAGHVHRASPPVVTVAFDPAGRLWRAAVREGFVLVASSADLGRSFGPEVSVNRERQVLWADGENRPKLGFDDHGRIHVTYTEKVASDDPMAGHVRHARSTDGGRSFSAPVIVNDDRRPISHRFDTLVVHPQGGAWLVWQDLRDAAPGRGRAGALYYAHAADGERFGANVKLVDGTCECCKVAAGLGADGVPVVFWRHVFEGSVRDHAMARVLPGATPQRVARDGWRIEGCPHQGPAMAVGSDGTLHFAWFTGAEGREGIGYARSGDSGATFRTPMRFTRGEHMPARPDVLALGRHAWVVWREFDGTTTRVLLSRSDESGQRWSRPAVVASATDVADNPRLLQRGGRVYLSWSVNGRPWQLQPLEEGA